MSVSWVIALIPVIQGLVPPPAATTQIVEALRPLATVGRREPLRAGHERVSLDPRNYDVPIALLAVPSNMRHVPFAFIVERFASPHDVMDTHAAPPRLLYSSALSIEIAFDGGPDLAARPPAEIDRAIRSYLGATLPRIESILHSKLRILTYVE